MKEIQLKQKSDKVIGAVRLPDEVFKKVVAIAKDNRVSHASVIRGLVIAYIDEAKFV